jgi:Mn2+/Fe2+ NRAMP family transporter
MLAGVDWFSKLLGGAMILMTFYVVLATKPPFMQALHQAIFPQRVDFSKIVTLVGGTIGGYIMFSGAHRLLDGRVQGVENVGTITWASVRGIIITSLMRSVLFLAVLGVVQTGVRLNPEAPVFDAFRAGAGHIGFVLSGLVFWSAAITSVVGCAYTSISFIRGHDSERRQSHLIVGFIILSLAVAIVLKLAGWQPTPLLIAAGTVNGILMPVILGVILVAAYRKPVMGEYRHPWWAGALGLVAWVITLFLAYRTIRSIL